VIEFPKWIFAKAFNIFTLTSFYQFYLLRKKIDFNVIRIFVKDKDKN